ncbi:putative ATP-dependent RNA helicase DHX57 [Biomphalaria glabrata]|uniref:Putative ATP-dependent RNA helicase DHX57 n=1 Tax=Biomphalaria glabrata TaxID=6526 RepID=A0A9W2ZTL4_BIOGL|nr:putative ATP-dependent RNA helicase DHX57 [Biomphalaria glabrata]XP_055878291.1 putative ATP-dependent RNA helicase DHX57 [Biomphalaria glabrata]XP_055878292.1 putative ATP-dependent RNA helicase DHX57 [Biomphalaria glabrata]
MDEDLYNRLASIFGIGHSSSMPHNVDSLSLTSDKVKLLKTTLETTQELTGKNPVLETPDLASQSLTQKSRYNQEEFNRTNKFLYKEFQKTSNSEDYNKMQKERSKLPSWEMRAVITAALEMYNVIIVCGMTGCGKTTQVPQFILDDALRSEHFNVNIVCTQPRRISAISVAERVAQERGEVPGKIVGYQIRLDGEVSNLTRLLFCTTGIVLRRLESDPDLEGVTHIIVDEVHERSEQSDFLLLVLKKLLVRRPDLRVILMSATIDAQLFSEYFSNCPVIEIPGKQYSVKQFFLEDILEKTNYVLEMRSDYRRNEVRHGNYYMSQGDISSFELIPDAKLDERHLKIRYPTCSRLTLSTLASMDMDKINFDLLVQLLEWIVTHDHKDIPKEGAILVFLPGLQEIQTTYDLLQTAPEFSRNKEKYAIIPIHSTFTTEEQKLVFLIPQRGIRKIVLATNIAETSITINDVVFVVDTGMMKEMRYDPVKSMQSLDMIRVSKTNVVQRMGRAGRVQEGVSFHMFTSHVYEYEMSKQPVPEIQRNCLEQIVIRTKILPIFKKYEVENILAQLVNPPSKDSIIEALEHLIHLGALDAQMKLTALGYHVGSLPVDVRIGKLMLYGVIFRCLDSTLTIAATLSFKSPFFSPFKKKEEATEKKKEFETNNSDILTMLKAYQEWLESREKGVYNFCRDNFLSYKTLEMLSTLKQQYVEILSDIGFISKGIKLAHVQYLASHGSDGVAEITGPEVNVNNSNMELLSSLLVAALYPNIIKTIPAELSLFGSSRVKRKRYTTIKGELVDLHPGSINFKKDFDVGSFLVYHEKVKTKKVYIRDCSLVSKLSLLMFGGGEISVEESFGDIIVKINKMIQFKMRNAEIALSLQALRSKLDQLLSDKISQPDLDLIRCSSSEKIINCIVDLLSDD